MASGAAKKIADAGAYASTVDFERIFTEDMSSLYLLALLLTGDRDSAKECFVTSIEEATKGNRVFKGWARSWARRTIIRSAIRLIVSRQCPGTMARNPVLPRELNYLPLELEAELSAILKLAPIERFVFVMAVLERFSEHDCSILLGCPRRDVAAALARGLLQLGSVMNSHKNKAEASWKDLSGLRSSGLLIEVTIAQYLATQARLTNLY